MVIPHPPTDAEKLSYLRTNRLPFYALGIFSFVVLIAGVWLFTLAHPYFFWFSLFAATLTFYLAVSYLIGVFGKDFDYEHHLDVLSTHKHYTPAVDVYLPACGEPLEILRNTYTHIAALDYPNLSVHVLDDGASDELKELAKSFNFNYIRRPNRGELKKAGNLRYAFTQTSADLILILDADFCPRPDFLKETVPHFAEDDKIAIVQTPQYFSLHPDQTWVEKGAGYIQELFYRMVQVNRDTFGGAICVGTCAVYRRTALEPFGGTAPIGYSEDVHTGFNVVSAGWKIKYLPLPLSKGVCPDEQKSFFIQQYRWSMGSITLFLNKEFWRSSLTPMQKICYASGMLYYMTTGIAVFLQFLPSTLLVWLTPELVLWYNVAFSLPSILFGTVFYSNWSYHPFGLYAPKVKVLGYHAHFFAFIDKLRDRAVAWVPSGAVTKKISRFDNAKSALLYWTTLTHYALVAGVAYRAHDYPLYNFIPVLILSTYNYWLNMSVLKDQT